MAPADYLRATKGTIAALGQAKGHHPMRAVGA